VTNTHSPLSGRRAQAARNDERILEAARAIFIADPRASINAVADRAGVGMSALYRRYPSKEDLVRRLCMEGLQRYVAAVEAALAIDGDAWEAFSEFVRQVVDSDVHSNTLRLAGTFTPSAELYTEARRANDLTRQLFERTKAAGAIRTDLVVDDLSFLFEQVASVRGRDDARTTELRRRYTALLLDALRATSPSGLPGPPPDWREIQERWDGDRDDESADG
jgi:AcrR family transcriptional regulator